MRAQVRVVAPELLEIFAVGLVSFFVSVTLPLALQLLLSVTDTVYVPADVMLESACVVAPVLHL